MNLEQERYMSLINQTGSDTICIKKTGWEEISLPMHVHDKCQVVYTLSGTLHVQVGTVNYFVPEKHVAWIPEGTAHKLCSNNRRVSLVIFYLSPDTCGEETHPAEFFIRHTTSFIAENLKFVASSGETIVSREYPELYDFVVGFFRLLSSFRQLPEMPWKPLAIPDDARLYPILAYLQEHLHEKLNMPELAAVFGFSVRNLSRLFNESGIRFSMFVNNLRVMRAIELVADGGRTMQQIAYETGFSTPNHFNRVFKKLTGVSPHVFLRDGRRGAQTGVTAVRRKAGKPPHGSSE